MAPMLWEHFNTDLYESPSRRLSTLLDPDNGILPYIRHLYVRGGSRLAESDLILLLGYLPRDRLISFVVSWITPTTLTFLLRQQT